MLESQSGARPVERPRSRRPGVRAFAAIMVLAVGTSACSGPEFRHYVDEPAAAVGTPGPVATRTADPRVVLPVLPTLTSGIRLAPEPREPCLLAAQFPDNTLGFGFDSATVSQPGAVAVRHFVKSVVGENADLVLKEVLTEGYTSADAPNQAAYDLDLSERRAGAVAEIAQGALSGVVVKKLGRGEASPFDPDATESQRSEERRTVLTFTFSGCKS